MGAASPDIPREIEKGIEDMPAISPILGKIKQISREMETSPKDLVKVIKLDPVLTGKVIKLVNSSFYGLAQRVQSLSQAVVLLGINTVKNLAISTALLSTVFIKGKQSRLDTEAFWRHCLATAVGCKLLAKGLRISPDDLETYFVAGILHDVGKVLFFRTDPERYEKALKESRRLGVSLAFAELAHFGCSHTQAGGVLARKWKLDDFLVEAIELHHSLPNSKTSKLKELVTVANNLCKRSLVGVSGNCVVEEMADDLAGRLGIQPDLLSQIGNRLNLELEKAEDFLNFVQEQ